MDAMARLMSRPEPPGWPGDAMIDGFPLASDSLSHSWSLDAKRDAPIVSMPLSSLVALQIGVDRKWVAGLIENGWKEPILVSDFPNHPGMYLIQDGHHRAYAALLMGMDSIPARVVSYSERKRTRNMVRGRRNRAGSDGKFQIVLVETRTSPNGKVSAAAILLSKYASEADLEKARTRFPGLHLITFPLGETGVLAKAKKSVVASLPAAKKVATKSALRPEDVRTFAVSGSAYGGSRAQLLQGSSLLHAVNMNYDPPKPLCGKVKATSLIDDPYAIPPHEDGNADITTPPTCPICLSKDPRFANKSGGRRNMASKKRKLTDYPRRKVRCSYCGRVHLLRPQYTGYEERAICQTCERQGVEEDGNDD